MGILEDFKKNKASQEQKLIDFLYDKVDRLNAAQIKELLRYTFIIFGDPKLGMFLIQLLVKAINKHIGANFVPRSKEDFEKWLQDFFSKIDLAKQRAILVTAIFDIHKHNFISASDLMLKVDQCVADLEKTPEFMNLAAPDVKCVNCTWTGPAADAPKCSECGKNYCEECVALHTCGRKNGKNH